MFKWLENYHKAKFSKPVMPETKPEELTSTRNLPEKLAGMEIGQSFAISTRTGMHVFKKVAVRPHEQIKNKEKA